MISLKDFITDDKTIRLDKFIIDIKKCSEFYCIDISFEGLEEPKVMKVISERIILKEKSNLELKEILKYMEKKTKNKDLKEKIKNIFTK